MKITIKANEKIAKAIIKQFERNAEDVGTKATKIENEIYCIEIDFNCSYLWSDLELWLEDDNGNYLDHLCMNVSKRNKLQTHK